MTLAMTRMTLILLDNISWCQLEAQVSSTARVEPMTSTTTRGSTWVWMCQSDPGWVWMWKRVGKAGFEPILP